MGNKNAKPRNIVPSIPENEDPSLPENEDPQRANLLLKFKHLLSTEPRREPGEEPSHSEENTNLLIKFKHLLSTEPRREPGQEPRREPGQEPRREPGQEPRREPGQEPRQESWQESRHNEENTNLLIKFKHLLKSDDVEDYIAEITTEENGKVTEKTKRIKIGDFKERPDA